MKVQILQHEQPAQMHIISTNQGKQALQTDEPTPRERQFLLLLDKDDSELSRQAVSLLLTKLDLNKIVKKGWVEYHVSDDLSVTLDFHDKNHQNVDFSVSTDKQTGQRKIKSFLSEYAQNPPKTLTTDLKTHIADSQNAEQPYHQNLQHQLDKVIDIQLPKAVNEDFEDVMILQSLL